MSKSTGPRTPRGKARSSQNAAKHWIKSGRILPDEEKDAAALRNGFVDDFDPQSSIEIELVNDLVLNRLIKRRIDACFTREFFTADRQKIVELCEVYYRSLALYVFRTLDNWSESPAPLERSERLHPKICVQVLEEMKRRIEESGPRPEDLSELRALYGAEPSPHALIGILKIIEFTLRQHGPDETVGGSHEDGTKQKILDALESEIKILSARLVLPEITLCAYPQDPPADALETLHRYRAANNREFSHLLDSLERVRRLRRG